MKQLLTLVLFLGVGHLLWSQSLDNYPLVTLKKSAEAAYDEGDYSTAYVHASAVLEDEPDNFVFLKIAAESALELCAFSDADAHFETIRSMEGVSYPLLTFFLAKSKHRQGEYLEAQTYYESFLQSYSQGVDAKYQELATQKLEECRNHENLFPGSIPGVAVSSMINNGYSDFALPYFGNTLYYSVVSPPDDCDCVKPCGDKTTIYQKIGYGSESEVTFPEGTKGVGHVTFANEGQRMYFTQCSCKDNEYTCAIYYSDQQGYNGQWGTPVKLPVTINREGYTSTQPHYADNAESEDYLYFVSDYHAGYSDRKDLDIFKVQVTGNTFGEPINVAEINTLGDEVTPFFFVPDQALYFSSNGRHSLGGFDFDIFKYQYSGAYDECAQLGNEDQNPANLGTSFNTLYDELYFSVNETGEKAVYSSTGTPENSGNSYGYGQQVSQEQTQTTSYTASASEEHCCPSIYQVDIQPTSTIVVSVLCANDGGYGNAAPMPMRGSVLNMYNLADSTNAVIPKQVEDDYRYYFAGVELGQNFGASVSKDGYWGDQKEFSSSFCNGDTVWVELFLEPQIELEVRFRAKCNPALGINVNGVTLVDRTDNSETVMTASDDKHTYRASLRSRHNYTILPDSVSKRADNNEYTFTTGTPSRDIVTTFSCEPQSLEEEFLLEIQPDTLPLFEPLPLYFMHAIPNPIYSATEAATDYETYFKDYSNRLEEFKVATGRCTTPNSYGYGQKRGQECDCNQDLTRVDTFFNEVQVNMNRMESFGEILLRALQGGDSIVINIRGVASKSGSAGYSNDNLSQRRINSMEKYLAKFFLVNGDGVNDFMDKVNVIPDPVGASIANPDAPSRGNCRIYNVDASYDRRIEIVSIVLFPPDMQSGPCAPGGDIETYQSNNSY